jgi:putative ATP-dependent endonuclease of OLD family
MPRQHSRAAPDLANSNYCCYCIPLRINLDSWSLEGRRMKKMARGTLLMRLRRLILENFRGYARRTEIDIAAITSLVGKNDAGKSTILEALAIFFGCDAVKIDQQDACMRGETGPLIRIGCVFDQFPRQIVIDARAPTSLEDEHLLNAEGLLEVVKVFDASKKSVPYTVYANCMHPKTNGAADLLQLKNVDLKRRAADLGIAKEAIADARSNGSLRAAIRTHLGPLERTAQLIPLEAEDGKKVWEQLQKVLPTFALFRSDRQSRDEDPEVQDPMALAVKEAVREVDADLEQVRQKVRDRVAQVARRTIDKLREMDPALASELTPEFRAEPKWEGFKLSLVGDGGVPINKRGSGVRRLILLNFLRAEAERRQAAAESPGVIYAIEEPETSQHPDNQAMLVRVLAELSERDGVQVLLTTHVPALAGLLPTESIRFVTRGADGHPEVRGGGKEILRDVTDQLGVLPDKRAAVLIYVEGPNDVVFLGHMARLLRADGDTTVPDIQNDPRIAFVVAGGGNLQHWVNEQYLANVGLREVHIYDRDTATPPKYSAVVDQVNARGGADWACLTSKREMENYLHRDAIADAMQVEVEFTDNCDVPALVAQAILLASPSPNDWSEIDKKTQAEKCRKAKLRLNANAAALMTRAMLSERDPEGEVRKWFEEIALRVNPAFVRATFTLHPAKPAQVLVK